MASMEQPIQVSGMRPTASSNETFQSPENSPSVPSSPLNIAICTSSHDKIESTEETENHRERPTTMLTPEPKRIKMIATARLAVPPVVSYPTTVPVPSTKIIRALYSASLPGDGEVAAVISPSSSPSYTALQGDSSNYNDQQYLKPAGVLSFEQVLLPALGFEEERALKKIQAKIQRDAPEYKFVMENCRRLVRQGLNKAVLAVQESRVQRVQQQKERRRQQALAVQRAKEAREEARREERQRQIEERKQQREMEHAKKRERLKRHHPMNLKLYKEIIFLTSSLAHLEAEERMWTQAEQELVRLERCNSAASNSKEQADTESSAQGNDDGNVLVLQVAKHPLHHETEQKVRDVVLASSRIQKGLGMVLKLLEESEQVQNELYSKYRQDHVFHGYQSVDNPKSLIRFLSQSQDDNF
mmetsp:Transcript_13089/g.24570  ORF Transcript_13089/g.24570 Transcript_13089/m.24570 type:complete len:415 (-) Transcript_13089:232-1476(-)